MWPTIQLNNFTFYSYPLFMGLAWGFAYQFTVNLLQTYADTRGFRLLFWGTFLSSWIGAKLLFLLTPGASLDYVRYSSFWLGGGFVFYGGLLLGVTFVILYTWILKKFPAQNIIFLLPSLAFAHAIGRVGCFLAGCCYGSETIFFIHYHHRHPVQLYEAGLLFVVGLFLLGMIKRNASQKNIIVSYFVGYAIIRFCLEFLRDDPGRGFVIGSLSTSQFISIFIILATIPYFFYNRRKI